MHEDQKRGERREMGVIQAAKRSTPEAEKERIERKTKKAMDLISCLISQKFYGKIELIFQKGEIVDVIENKRHQL